MIKLLNKYKLKSVSLILLLTLLVSCDYEASIDYQIENKTDGIITVVFESTSGIVESDSVKILRDSLKTIVIQGKGLRRVDNYKENLEFLKEFSRMDIFKNDSTKSKTDFLKSENWEYIEYNAHQATEKCIVEDADFK